jgi:hypothetical protein
MSLNIEYEKTDLRQITPTHHTYIMHVAVRDYATTFVPNQCLHVLYDTISRSNFIQNVFNFKSFFYSVSYVVLRFSQIPQFILNSFHVPVPVLFQI